MIRIIVLGALTLLIAGCGSHRVKDPPNPAIHSIALIPASNPRWYTFENATPPIGYPFQHWVNKGDSHRKAGAFNADIDPRTAKLGDALTGVVAKTLRERGFTVEVMEDVLRPPEEPDNVDEEHVETLTQADAVLHIWIDEIGLYSGHLSTQYVPRVNVRGKLWARHHEDTIYDDGVYYGVDARKGKVWAIAPAPQYQWDSFDAVMSSIDAIRTAFGTGTEQAAAKLSEQVAGAAAAAGPHSAAASN